MAAGLQAGVRMVVVTTTGTGTTTLASTAVDRTVMIETTGIGTTTLASTAVGRMLVVEMGMGTATAASKAGGRILGTTTMAMARTTGTEAPREGNAGALPTLVRATPEGASLETLGDQTTREDERAP